MGRLLEATGFDESWYKFEIETKNGKSEVDREVIRDEVVKILN